MLLYTLCNCSSSALRNLFVVSSSESWMIICITNTLLPSKIKLIYTITQKYQHTNNSNIVYTWILVNTNKDPTVKSWQNRSLKIEHSIRKIISSHNSTYPTFDLQCKVSNHLINKSENVDFEHNIVRHSQLKYANISYSQTIFPRKCRPTSRYDTWSIFSRIYV